MNGLIFLILALSLVYTAEAGGWFDSVRVRFPPPVVDWKKSLKAKETVGGGNDGEDVKQTQTTFTYQGEVIDETITAIKNRFVVTYEVKTGKGKATVVDDYRKLLRVFNPPDKDVCIISPITPEVTFTSGEDFVAWATRPDNDMIEDKIIFLVKENAQPVKDYMNLGKEAIDLCGKVPAFWGIMEDGSELDDINDAKQKRSWEAGLTGSYGRGGNWQIGGSLTYRW